MCFYFLLLASLAQASFSMTSRDRWVTRNILVDASPAFGSSEAGVQPSFLVDPWTMTEPDRPVHRFILHHSYPF
jgi:hypothetical protein